MSIRLSWGVKVGMTAAGMVAMLMFVPVRTSLGQGIHENIVTGWVGRYDHLSHQYFCRIETQNGVELDIPIPRLPSKLLTNRGHGEFWTTGSDKVRVLTAAFHAHPHMLEEDLGTRANVADRLSPFPGRPVAYRQSFLESLSRLHFNPRRVGGPNIPPTTRHWGPLTDGLLQIDTRADNNTLVQLRPGEVPAPLEVWRRQHGLGRVGPIKAADAHLGEPDGYQHHHHMKHAHA